MTWGAWWEAYKHAWSMRWRRWTARRYPKIIVEYDDGSGLLERDSSPDIRDCGHLSRSFAYDPLREETVCLGCYRRAVGHRRR